VRSGSLLIRNLCHLRRERSTEPLDVVGTEFEHEYRLLLSDGRVKHVHAIAHAVRNASGDREFIGAVTDITERKTTEDKIRRLVDANILGIFIADIDGACIVGANEAMLRMLQYSREDLVSRRMLWADLTPPEWHERKHIARFWMTVVMPEPADPDGFDTETSYVSVALTFFPLISRICAASV
jgi:PAS domain-containing protein